MSERLEEIHIKNQFDLNQAISDLQFYYTTLVHGKDDAEFVMELWSPKKGVVPCHAATLSTP